MAAASAGEPVRVPVPYPALSGRRVLGALDRGDPLGVSDALLLGADPGPPVTADVGLHQLIGYRNAGQCSGLQAGG
ncbi:hypothetical protein ACWDTT_12560 [Streptosporangium sandarakinum]|uniref:hypothetical protein n=1 Tax=Streptosporangium TaxID=2000 RepID=UPI0035E61699